MRLERSTTIMLHLAFLAGIFPSASAFAHSSAGSSSAIPVIQDAKLRAMTTTVGGASVLPTTRTVVHWWGSTVDPHNGVTYGYNMVGADPNNCTGANCSVTIEVDITPIVVNIDGRTFSGEDILGGTMDSPLFTVNDYGSTPHATNSQYARGPGGALSQGDAGRDLQLQDAIMRAQFGRTGSSSDYHLILDPVVLAPVTINVPRNQGILLQSGRGVVFADVNISWWLAKIQRLETSADPTHLPLYLTNNVMLYVGTNPLNCCVIGFHGARAVGYGGGSVNSRGKAVVQTFAWGSWVQPGLYSHADGGANWALQDIHALSHEISEWSDDPFVDNVVEPWITPTAPQYGCSDLLETGDPVVDIGFAMGTNVVEQGPNPDGSQSADGYYHPEDEVLLPWFMRSSPNNMSEQTQTSSSNVGRYTFMGDLNPFAGFRQPASGC